METHYITHVLDAGGRYGIHPSWKPFTGELEYLLFEPDKDEAERLKLKYARRSDEIKVLAIALAEKTGRLQMNFFRNRAMSSSVKRNPVSTLFMGERLKEIDIIDYVEVDAEAIDSFCDDRGISLDFLKLDTEGTEHMILSGAEKQLRENVLGVRCEVNFEQVFEGMPLFSAIHEFMISRGFFLLNLDYEGRGENQNDCVVIPGRYGILTDCDAIWLKRQPSIFAMSTGFHQRGMCEARVLKYAAFCLLNNATDVAIDVLINSRRQRKIDFDVVADSRLYKFVDHSVQKLFYALKWQPGQSLRRHADIYFEIFGKKMKEMNEFMESIELNPD